MKADHTVDAHGHPPRPAVAVSTAHLLPPDQSPDGTFDRDINLGGIVKTMAVLAVVAALSFAASAWIVKDYVAQADAADPVSPLAAERRAVPLPLPRLATDPVGEIVDLKAEEATRLGSYAWADRGLGVARVPIERAIEIMAARGGSSPFPPPAASAQTGAVVMPSPPSVVSPPGAPRP